MPWNGTCGSLLIAAFFGYQDTYTFCNSVNSHGQFNFQTYSLLTGGGGAGPSACATGTPSNNPVVSGTCQGWPKPSWQSGIIGNPNDAVRDLPDVSLFAADGVWNTYYVFCYTHTAFGGHACTGDPATTWTHAGGTSFSAPIWAGIQALINVKAAGPQGLPNYQLYQLAGAEYGTTGSSACNSSNGSGVSTSCIFYDVTLDNDATPCNTYNCYNPNGNPVGVISTTNASFAPAYNATTGWDFATGIGTVNVANLVNGWNKRPALATTHDFDGDKTSDILWRDTSGNLAMWLMSNGQFSSGAGISQVASIWSVVGTHRFNGDRHADILWLATSGDLGIWVMNGPAVTSYNPLGNVGMRWSVVGTGDFNGDGTGDILWSSSTAEVAVWFMSNGQLLSGVNFGSVPQGWSVTGTGDFNGDGTTDILWRNSETGDLAIWLMKNGQFLSGIDLGNVPSIWSVVGTGDFDGDGTSDILWRDTSGNLAIWLMSNGQMVNGSTLAQVPTTWSVAETGDFDGDAKSDILWSDNVGNLGVWLMNGLTVKSEMGLGNVGSSWQVQGLNAD
jgi:hypothetical protein